MQKFESPDIEITKLTTEEIATGGNESGATQDDL